MLHVLRWFVVACFCAVRKASQIRKPYLNGEPTRKHQLACTTRYNGRCVHTMSRPVWSCIFFEDKGPTGHPEPVDIELTHFVLCQQILMRQYRNVGKIETLFPESPSSTERLYSWHHLFLVSPSDYRVSWIVCLTSQICAKYSRGSSNTFLTGIVYYSSLCRLPPRLVWRWSLSIEITTW